MADCRRVAILLHGTFGYAEGVLRGVSEYVSSHADWVTHWLDPELELLDKVRTWKPDGVVGNIFTKPIATAVLSLGVPVVSVSGNLFIENIPRVAVENDKVSQMAVEYFWNLGFRNFACMASARRWNHKLLHTSFSALVAERGVSCSVFTGWYPERNVPLPYRADPYPDFRAWLTGLPKPVALFCVQDSMAFAAMEVAHECGIRVPDDIAVLGADNSQVLCMLSNPSLSSIVLPLEKIGFQACEILREQMDGHDVAGRQVMLPPIRVAERGSTDVVTIRDPQVANAMRFIRSNASNPISVDDILEHVNVSRRALEQRFRKTLRCTPLEAVHAAQIQLATRLLSETELSMPEIAERAGFSSAGHMSTLFRSKMGTTPTQYRKQQRH